MPQHDSLRQELLAEVATVAPIVAEQLRESEKLRHLYDVISDALRKTRLLRFLYPRDLGG